MILLKLFSGKINRIEIILQIRRPPQVETAAIWVKSSVVTRHKVSENSTETTEAYRQISHQ